VENICYKQKWFYTQIKPQHGYCVNLCLNTDIIATADKSAYDTVISSSDSEKSECLNEMLESVLFESSRLGERQKCDARGMFPHASSSSSSSSDDFLPTSLRSGWGLVLVGRVCSRQPPEDSSSLSLEFLHFILRFWNQILTCLKRWELYR